MKTRRPCSYRPMILALICVVVILLPTITFGHLDVSCPPGWIPRGGTDKCYYLPAGDHRPAFWDAKAYCENIGGMLATARNRNDLEWLAHRMNPGWEYRNWIGLYQADEDNQWRWLDDNSNLNAEETPWVEGNPTEGQRCGALDSTSKLLSLSCDIENSFICQRGLGEPMFCDVQNGWEQVGPDACFKIRWDGQEWEEARKICKSEDGFLLEPRNSVESKTAVDMVRFRLRSDTWIGYHEQGAGYDWAEEHDAEHVEPNFAGEPPSLSGHGAAYIMAADPEGHWGATLELEKKPFICRRNKGGCVPGWQEWAGVCYHFDFDAGALKGYDENNAMCSDMGTNMLRMSSAEQQIFVDHQLAPVSTQIGVWTGLKELVVDNHEQYMWENGEPFDPNAEFNLITDPAILSDDCFSVTYWMVEEGVDGTQWLRTPCYEPQFSACQIPVNTPLTITVSNEEYHCPDGWMLPWSGICYLFVGQEMEWSAARQFCMLNKTGADLVSIGSVIEQEHVHGLVVESQIDIWFGFNDLQQEDVWIWSDGSAVNYHHEDPMWSQEGEARYNCAFLRANDGFWQQRNCASVMPFVCEVPAAMGPVPTNAPPVTDTWSAACGPGWKEEPSSGRCYMFMMNSLTFFNAEYDCNAIGGSLLSVNTPQEQNFIDGLVAGENLQGYVFWIGGFEADEGGWRWNDGSPFAFINWSDGEPNNVGEEDCMTAVFLTGSVGKWNDVNCENRYSSICEKPGANFITPAPPTTFDTSCPDGWTVFEGNCYHFPPDMKMTWENARGYCQGANPGADLAVVQSNEENDFILGRFDGSVFIGAHWVVSEDGTTGQFWWVDGQPLTYQNFADGEPSGNGEDCVEIMFSGTSSNRHGRWNDVSCQSEQRFVCEYEPRLCPDGFDYHHGTCYQFVMEDATQADAEAKCRSIHEDAHLPSIHSPEENAYLHEHREATTWLGFVRTGEEWSSWAWLDNTTVDFFNWNEGEPNNAGSGESCAVMVSDSAEWNDVPCDYVQRVTCKYKPSHVLGCPIGWQNSGRLCYAIINEPLHWSLAEAECRVRGGFLASILEQSEQDYLESVIKDPEDKPCPDGWIRYETRCYYISNTPAMYDEAMQLCRQGELQSSDLVWIFEPHENDFLKSLNLIVYTRSYWIGLDNRNPDKTYRWTVDGSDLKWSDWYMNADAGDNRCATFMGGPLQWGTDDCVGKPNHFICSGYIRKEPTNYWIGFNDRNSENYFQWADGSETTLTAWNYQMPSKGNGDPRHCVFMASSDALWVHDRCDMELPYICSKKRTLEPVPEPDEGCEIGQIGFGSSCYFVLSDKLPWFTADGRCEARHSLLASLNSAEEAGWVASWLRTIGRDAFWIGLTDDAGRRAHQANSTDVKDEVTHNFYWQDGEPVEYTNWGTGQPSAEYGGCVFVSTKEQNFGLWYVGQCEGPEFQSVCEKPRKVYTDAPQPTTPIVAVDCPHGWKKFDNHCYKYFKQPPQERLSWQASREICKKFGEATDLVSYTSREEEHVLFDPHDENIGKVETVWIGLHDSNGNGWEWSDGAPVVYLHWQIGEPPAINDTASNTQHCAALDIDYTSNGIDHSWRSHSCDAVRDFACEMPAGTTPGITLTLPTAPPPEECVGAPEGWTSYKGSCYLIVPGSDEAEHAKDWHMARVDCIERGGELASIHTQEENTYILSQLNQYPDHRIFIGLNRFGLNGPEDQFRWSDSSPLDFVFWAPSEPNNFDNQESCVTLYNGGLDGYWNDDNCGSRYGYVCKICKDNCPQPPVTEAPYPGGCPAGWMQFGDNCYITYTLAMDTYDFQGARQVCKQNGSAEADLVSIHSIRENAFVHTMLVHAVSGTSWIGLTDTINDNSRYMWTDQSSVNYVNWGVSQPMENDQASGQKLDCVKAHQKSGRWYTADCSTIDSSVTCKRKTQPSVNTPPPPKCVGDYRNFEAFDGDCYLSVTEDKKTWQDAEDFCLSKRAHLASVRTKLDNNYLVSRSEGTTRYWLGLKYDEDAGRFEWSDGKSVEHTEWGANDPPTKPSASNCGAINPENGEWATEDCKKNTFAFFCKYSEKVEPTITAIGDCPDYSWQLSGVMCYKPFFDEQLTFTDANLRCQNLGGHLASVHSPEENAFIQGLVHNGTNNDVWLGLVRDTGAGWTWTDGSEIEYVAWNKDEPNGLEGETCVEMYKFSGAWNDITCESQRDFICKAPSKYTTSWPKPTGEGQHDGDGGSSSAGAAAGIIVAIVVAIALVGGIGFTAYSRPIEFQTMKIRVMNLFGAGNDPMRARERDTITIETDDVIS